jgi:hypothetical protein
MEILTFLAPLFGKLQDPAVLVPTLGMTFLGYLHIIWRREEREDRQKMLEAFNHLVEAMHEVRVALAALTGRG